MQVFLVLPLLLVYEAGLLLSGGRRRNAADALLKAPFEALGREGVLIFNTLLVLLFVLATLRLRNRRGAVARVALPLFLESALYAVVLAPLVRVLGRGLHLAAPAPSGIEEILLSVGAGVYEEIVFRFGVATLVLLLFEDVLRTGRLIAALLAVAVSGLLFSWFHHVGPFGEPFSRDRFAFRALAGGLLTTLYVLRGLAPCVWTHALYDVLLVVGRR